MSFGQAFLKACAGQGREALGALRVGSADSHTRCMYGDIILFGTRWHSLIVILTIKAKLPYRS